MSTNGRHSTAGEGIRLLEELCGTTSTPFALLRRPGSNSQGTLDLVLGHIVDAMSTADIPEPERHPPGQHEMLVVLPYRLIGERGYAYHDDGVPVLAMTITDQAILPVDEVVALARDWPVHVLRGDCDTSDETFAQMVRQIITNEVDQGSGANFVIKRSFVTDISNWSRHTALALYTRLLRSEPNAYWTFMIYTGRHTFIGASPERHTSLDRGTVVMNPMSGIYRYPPSGPTEGGALDFLADGKETNELHMVLDEELKLMSRLCDLGARVLGPRLKEMAHLAHIEYLIEGATSLDFREILRETMFTPSVMGSPVESACRVIARFEPEGRGYYGGAAVLLGRDAEGERRLDSTILIRTADIDSDGEVCIGVGSTLARDADPAEEAANTRVKATSLLDAMHGRDPRAGSARSTLNSNPAVRVALAERNAPLSQFWLREPEARVDHHERLVGAKLLVIDAGDTFTVMGRQILQALGLEVTVRRIDEPLQSDGHDAVIIGSGPGDPRDHGNRRIARLREITRHVLDLGTPLLSVCLGHQVLSSLLGLEVVRRPTPHEGVQREITLFGQRELVCFRNTFEVRCPDDTFECDAHPGTISVCREPVTGEVYALRGDRFTSIQFHPASIMTTNGTAILGDLLTRLLRDNATGYQDSQSSRAIPDGITI